MEKSQKINYRFILHAAALAVITGVTCYAAAKQHTSLFLSNADYSILSGAFFLSVLFLFLLSSPLAEAVAVLVVGIAASIKNTDYLFLFLPAILFLILLYASEKTDKRSTSLFTGAAVLAAGLFVAGLIAAAAGWGAASADLTLNRERSTPCAVFMLFMAAYFVYRFILTDKKKTEKTAAKKKSTGKKNYEKTKTAFLFGTLSAVSSAVYMFALRPVYEVKTAVGIWATVVLLTELQKRGWLLPEHKTQEGN